jgi:hypothetical protein
MNENIQKTLAIVERMKQKSIDKISIGFSTGKDSLVGYDIMQKSGINIIPVYFYIVPKIKFIEANLKMYEDYYQVHIIRLPHPMLTDYINYTIFQPLHKAIDMSQYYSKNLGFKGYLDWYFEKEGIDCHWDANCMKMADSINRRLLMRGKPDIDEEKKIIYIAKYLTDHDCWEYIHDNKIPITKDYEIFGRSADDLMNYQYLIGIKKFYPKDYQTIIEYFPLAEMEILRYEAYKNIYEKS